MSTDSRAVSKSLEKKILALVKDNIRQVKKGANEVTKQIERSKALLVIMALDTEPIQIIEHLPLLCDDKGISYIYVSSSEALGNAVGLQRPAVACCITYEDDQQYEKVKSGVSKVLSEMNGVSMLKGV
ncbi:60S ribosomal protein 15.5kD/SNU13, NHP2/L7A family [Pseudoloma neurophilia]|uniref:60S ribosomal protein 15.5kD/SNU13, NHP2/L7A family n=1 Tax=Pseudoloma neurophilia TaxID=146866 RepID=A0A0R0LVQ0_9MICR|nr:60S ribosomal protein 15.5kD/SNU13, NHP2/L7A family [Pseudoloma neurophilia]